MKRLLTVLAFLAVFPGVAGAASPRFLPLDVHLDTPVPVAAWQFELKDANGAMTVVGVENGGHPAYPRAPYYDREALAQGGAPRIVVADYSLAEANRLPSGRVRLATLHLMLDGNPDFDLRLIAAAGPDGGALDASISLAARTNNLQETSR
ncbi:MAG: hypothetical protein OXK82_04060 [Deltaproteobacteria bacterium]|nr:hypothetical protein [Deltaproteobacteria bacterium]